MKLGKLRKAGPIILILPALVVFYISISADIDTQVMKEDASVGKRHILAFPPSTVLPTRNATQLPNISRTLDNISQHSPHIEAKPLPTRINHELVKYYEHPLLTICEDSEGERKIAYAKKHEVFNDTNQVDKCRSICEEDGETYATLIKGICWCYSYDYKIKPLIDLEFCDATCFNEKDCQDKRHAVTMVTGKQDGDIDWTVWMKMPELGMKIRYRTCHRSSRKYTACTPEFQRRKIQSVNIPKQVLKRYIGCFTGRSVVDGTPNDLQQTWYSSENGGDELYTYQNIADLHKSCLQFCSSHQMRYALLSTQLSPDANRTCYCSDTLAQSQPTDSCNGQGYAVYWIPGDSSVTLKFSGEIRKKGKVLVLARYRSGSSMTQSFFSKFPGSMTLFEPCKLKYFSPNITATDKSMMMALEAFYRCDVTKLPIFFYSAAYIPWTVKMLRLRGAEFNHLDEVVQCFISKPSTNCAPYWLEACQRSEFMNVKVIRLFARPAIEEFIIRNPDVHVVHLVRDPRGLLSAQKLFGTRDPPDMVCNQMQGIGEMVKDLKQTGVKNVHEVFYESLAVNTSLSGAKLYREMNLPMPAEVQTFLSRKDYEAGAEIPKNLSEVIVSDPKYHIYRFIERYTLENILAIDKNCSEVYNFWPEQYQSFDSLVKRNKDIILKHVNMKNRPLIKQYIQRMTRA